MRSDLINRPTAIKPSIDRVSVAIADTRELGCTKLLATKLQLASVAAIAVLFRSSGPAAITRLIVACCVNAIKRMIRARSLSHVLKKSGGRFSPAIAHGYALAAVIGVVAAATVVAPPKHFSPSTVFGCVGLLVFPGELLATTAFALRECGCGQEHDDPAVAVAFPRSPECTLHVHQVIRPSYCGQHPASLPSHIDRSHAGDYTRKGAQK